MPEPAKERETNWGKIKAQEYEERNRILSGKPTKEQEQLFWKRCGFKVIQDKFLPYDNPHYDIYYPDGSHYLGTPSLSLGCCFPPIDLNNLDKYALPELNKRNLDLITETFLDGGVLKHEVSVLSREQSRGLWTACDTVFADALFWAIFEALGGRLE